MNRRLLLVALLCGGSVCAAEPQTLFFAKETAKEFTRIALTIEGDQVSGTQAWNPKEGHGARGTFSGTIADGGIIRVVYEYTIEGSEQAEEEILKLEGDKLYIGEGELVETKAGRLKLKEPNKVVFKKALTRINVSEPKPGTPERKAIMEALRVPVSKHVGKPVTFTGRVRVSGSWASLTGNAATIGGKAPKKREAAEDLDLDLYALLKKDSKGAWQVLEWGFAGDIGLTEEMHENHPKAPWALFGL